MWEYERSVATSAGREAVWRCWSDMAAWPQWNAGIASIEIDGPFAMGTTFRMTAPGEDEPVTLRLARIVPGEEFTDEMDAGDFIVSTVHRLEDLPGAGTRIVYRTEISGPAADQVGPELGPQITADFPDVLDALVRLAES
jgi:uncharacterized protein YndB with AHSA1/START domain